MKLYEMISEMPMFKSFSHEEKNEFVKMEHSFLGFKKGDVIIKEGDAFISMYLLIKGIVLITKSEQNTIISKLTPGVLFGEMSFFTNNPRYTNVIADEEVMVIKMDDSFFKQISVEIKDKIKDYIIEMLISRLDSMNESMAKLARYNESIAKLARYTDSYTTKK